MHQKQGFGLIPLIIIIAIVAALTAGGFYLKEKIQQAKLEQVAAQNDQQRMGMVKQGGTPTPTPSKTPTASPTATWKTYRNEQYGFEMRYPQNWSYRITSHQDIPVVEFGKIGTGYWNEKSSTFAVGIYVLPDEVTALDTPNTYAVKENRYNGTVTGSRLEDYLGIRTYMIQKNKLYMVAVSKSGSGDPLAPPKGTIDETVALHTYNSMLSTFKFTK